MGHRLQPLAVATAVTPDGVPFAVKTTEEVAGSTEPIAGYHSPSLPCHIEGARESAFIRSNYSHASGQVPEVVLASQLHIGAHIYGR